MSVRCKSLYIHTVETMFISLALVKASTARYSPVKSKSSTTTFDRRESVLVPL